MIKQQDIQAQLLAMLQTVTLNSGYHRFCFKINSTFKYVSSYFPKSISTLLKYQKIKIYNQDKNYNNQLINQVNYLNSKNQALFQEIKLSMEISNILYGFQVFLQTAAKNAYKNKGKRIKTDPDKTIRSQDGRNISSALGGMGKKQQKMYEHQRRSQQDYQNLHQPLNNNQYNQTMYRQNQNHFDKDSRQSQQKDDAPLRPTDRDNKQFPQTSAKFQTKQPKIKSFKQRPRSSYQYSADKKKKRSEKVQRKNFFQSVVDVFINEKNNTLKANSRDQRKNKNRDLQQAKYRYNSYLKNYAKQNKIRKNRLSMENQPLENRRQLPLNDFDNIQNFFQAFSYKFRDQKTAYLRHIQRLIKKQQVDRMCYKNKIERQAKADMQKGLQKQIDSINHQHGVKMRVIKQRQRQNQKNMQIMRKGYEQKMRQQKKDLKQQKKKQLKIIQSFIQQQNEKVLMSMEIGGRLQQIIMELYKRY